METLNETFETSIDAAKLDAFVNNAQEAYKNYKSAAMKSAANCYLFWFHAASEQADGVSRSYFDDKVAERNDEIDRFNNALPALEARVAAFVNGGAGDITVEEKAKLE